MINQGEGAGGYVNYYIPDNHRGHQRTVPEDDDRTYKYKYNITRKRLRKRRDRKM